MRTMMLLLAAIIMAMAPATAYAFNTFQLMDPDFQRFVLADIPLAMTLGLGIPEALALQIVLQPANLPFRRMLWRMLRANLAAILLSIAAVTFMAFIVTGTMISTKYRLPILFAVGYFGLAFAGFAWWRKVKAIRQELDYGARLAASILAVTTALGYGALYLYIYARMFDYPE